MSERPAATPGAGPVDQAARDRFRDEWDRNFAVGASAGSGKTTAISERLAALALLPQGGELLAKTAVVTFTRKAAAQIGQRARQVLLRRLAAEGRTDLRPLDLLERAFFGTIHSFCLLLARRYGQALGVNLNPAVVAEDDDALWEEFLEQDPMRFSALAPAAVAAFLRHAPLESIFGLARRLDRETAQRFRARTVAPAPPEPSAAALQDILAASTRHAKSAPALQRNQAAAVRWRERFRNEREHLPFLQPEGTAAKIPELFARFHAPVKAWLAEAGAVLAAELALRYRAWRFERGVQTYADQVDAALAVLHDRPTLERIRAEDWRVILDEAQDTDPQQFAVLVEITRPPGSPLGEWPEGGAGPRPGRFCLVGDGQQAIYGSRADIRNFQRHLEAFARGTDGELLTFDVTFRAPHRLIELLNRTLPAAFGTGREHNLDLPQGDAEPPRRLQVAYSPLVAGPDNVPGAVGVLPLAAVGEGSRKVADRLAAEVRQVAAFLRAAGPAGVGASSWGEVCLLAPRNEWLIVARKELEAAGLKVALQMRRNRNGDHPVYAWICGLLAALCDPENAFEWTGVLREIFGVSDAAIARALSGSRRFRWDEPETYADESLRSALATLRPLVERVDAEAEPLDCLARDLVQVTGLVEKARAVDPSGGLEGELERLVAQAAELGLDGAGPREWLRELLAKLEEGRPAGKSSSEAINLLTSHSAKGLEWPVVIPLGLWRPIGSRSEEGLRLVTGRGGQERVFFDAESLPAETRLARERERLRELVRLLYVTLTRARRSLVLPWGAEFSAAEAGSFASLWGADLGETAGFVAPDVAPPARPLPPALPEETPPLADREARPPYPARILPHQLARKPDLVRLRRHESATDEAPPADREDPIEYGLWWHETLEFVPWRGDEDAVNAHLSRALELAARHGFRERAAVEAARLRQSPLWRELRQERWEILAELSVVAPLGERGWVDGVIDLVASDRAGDGLLVLDWKTNRPLVGEGAEALLGRLLDEYRAQLEAYGECLRRFFPHRRVQLGVYATAVGEWRSL
ncbi:MAG: UvrD-helicase domain-containing protein [Opitutaceae bacterium]|nr:UvrD-helicase domain-containing protein [Opitutaceae bacterium]